MKRLLLLLLLTAGGLASAQLTESEKQLLRGSISSQAAEAAGKVGDTATLQRIVELGDPALVPYFGTGMQRTNVYVMAPEVEAVVVRHFDHPKMGAALRALPGRYASRALFDRHLARVKSAYRSDEPSLEQILRTEQAGIDEDLLAVAGKFESRHGQPSGVANFLGRRRHPGAVPLLLAAIRDGYEPPFNTALHNTALDLLIAYRSEEIWRKAAAELERLRGEGKVRDDQYAHARRKLDPMLVDPAATLASMRSRDLGDVFVERKRSLAPLASQANDLRNTSPREYVAARARYLEAEEGLASEFNDEQVDGQVAYSWTQLGMYARFVVGDPKGAVRYLERGAKGREILAQVVLADTYQLALNDPGAALKAYERALENATRQAGVHAEFWKAWLAAEIAYLRTGKPFAGHVPEPVIAGFWDVVGNWGQLAALSFPEWPAPMHLRQPMMAGGHFLQSTQPAAAPGWEAMERALGRIDRAAITARIGTVPASRFALMATLRYISAHPEADAIRRELARSDPSGYWTTIVLGTVAYHESSSDRRAAALANGLAEALPGMAAKPNVLATAARQHMQSRALGTVERKP